MPLIHIPRFPFKHFASRLLAVSLLAMGAAPAPALDLVPGFMKPQKVNRTVWEDREQYVRVVPQDAGEAGAPPANEHPAHLVPGELADVLASLQLWMKGGMFRDEQTTPLFDGVQLAMLAQYIAEGLATAKPQEDITFNVRGYGKVAFEVAKERFWTAGRVFVVDGQVNVIIGTHQVKKQRATRNVEAAHGVLDDYRDLLFEPGSRTHESEMTGRIAASEGVALHAGAASVRRDWATVDIPVAVAAYRNSQIPESERKRDKKLQAETAKLTIERRQMREEMARLRKELNDMKRRGASAQTVEERLATLQKLRDTAVISEKEFEQRRAEILKDI